jgi:hypothetical protein
MNFDQNKFPLLDRARKKADGGYPSAKAYGFQISWTFYLQFTGKIGETTFVVEDVLAQLLGQRAGHSIFPP